MKRVIGGVLICILLISVFFVYKSFSSTSPVAEVSMLEETVERNLRISAVTDKNADFKIIPIEQGNYKKITYLDVNNVTINIGGTRMRLEDALLKGFVSIDEIIAAARKDAKDGLCGEVAMSKNGLTEFRYYYQEFTLRYIYDVYETPDGGEHLITDFLIYGVGSDPQFVHEVDEEIGTPIDYEDWGLNFEVSQLDSSSITIKCSQSGGQQLGKLNVGGVVLFKKNPNSCELEHIPSLNEEGDLAFFAGGENWRPDPNDFLTMEGTKELSLNFAQLYGKLPAGKYEISMLIVDCYNKEDVHSLMRNFYDRQWYAIEFVIE